jgi:hypothetical protein
VGLNLLDSSTHPPLLTVQQRKQVYFGKQHEQWMEHSIGGMMMEIAESAWSRD